MILTTSAQDPEMIRFSLSILLLPIKYFPTHFHLNMFYRYPAYHGSGRDGGEH